MSSLSKIITAAIVVLGAAVLALGFWHAQIIVSDAHAGAGVKVPAGSAVAAAEQEAGKPALVEKGPPSLWEVLKSGGLVMLVLFLLSMVTVALIVYYLLALSMGNLMPAGFIERLEEIVRKRRFDEAGMFVKQHASPFARIVEVGIEAAGHGREVVHESISSEGARQASSLWQKISYLNDIAIIAPMLGLLGTVVGMLDSFLAISSPGGTTVGMINPAALTNGVAKALITTVAGLIVGIIATIAYAYFRGVIQRMVVMLEAGGARFADLIEKGAGKD